MITRLFPPLAFLNVPNVMTLLAVVLGVQAVASLSAGHHKLALLLYIVVLGLDFLDGVVARRLGQQSAIGEQVDSLADAVDFCALPALMGWMIGLRAPTDLLLLGLYVAAGVWRLAWFNTAGLEDDGHGQTYRGLPTTYVAGVFVAVTCLSETLGADTTLVLRAYFPLAALAMLSGLRIKKRGALMPVTMISTLVCAAIYAATT